MSDNIHHSPRQNVRFFL